MKNFLVVGASSGIGKAVAEKLTSEGHSVWGTYHQHAADSEDIHYHPLDVREKSVHLDFLPEHLHGLVYCPGSILLRPFPRMSSEDFLADYDLQVGGLVRILQAALPRLKAAGQSSVVSFSSVAGGTGLTFHSIVSANKSALEGLTRALAAELAPSIRVNCVAPSLTDTPLAQALLNTPEKREANAQRHPLKRVGTSQEIAALVSFLLSEDAGWITGQVIHADGGMSSIR